MTGLFPYVEPRAVSRRTLCRHAKRAFAEMGADERAAYERAARRSAESDLTLDEFAVAAGLDLKLLWRTRRSLRLADRGGGVAA